MGVPVRDLPADCREFAATPKELFAKLRRVERAFDGDPARHHLGLLHAARLELGQTAHAEQNDPGQQRLIEVFSGHGNSEQFRPYREVAIGADGARTCPAPADDYLPSCWRAGEIIEARCRAENRPESECAERAADRAAELRRRGDNGGAATVPGSELARLAGRGPVPRLLPAGVQLPPAQLGAVHHVARARSGPACRCASGWASSRRATTTPARPGTGYKEVARTEFTETRFGNFLDTPVGRAARAPDRSRSPSRTSRSRATRRSRSSRPSGRPRSS